ncbi:MAG: glycosyltransferase involved in cell wall biosynthesis [Flavobacteriaceae bacterium]|jgi:glycosyltransferase involved in cell wall biosynthesis
MKILYVHQYYRTPNEGGCVRSFHIAKAMKKAGHKVTVITSHNYPSSISNEEGIDIHRLNIPYSNEMGFFSRIMAFLKFASRVKNIAPKLIPETDLTYVVTTPLSTGLIALHLKRKYDVPYYFEVGDLWPEVPIKMGIIDNKWLANIIYKFETKCYQNAKKVIALSPAIKDYILAKSPSTEVVIVTNFADNELFLPNIRQNAITQENPVRIAYAGTFGRANHLEYLLEVAILCEKANLPILFTLMGEGQRYRAIQEQAKNIRNLEVLPFGNLTEVKNYLEACDAAFVSFLNVEALHTGSPNKFFDGLAAGKMIIANFEGWIGKTILESNCGFTYNPEVPQDFIDKIQEVINDLSLLQTYQKNARSLAESTFSKGIQIEKLLKSLY